MMQRDIIGLVSLVLSLMFYGSWAPTLRLVPMDTKSSSATLETARFIGGTGEVIRSLLRDDVLRDQCYEQIDLTSAYFTVSLVPFLLAFVMSDNHQDILYGLSWALVLFSCLGGFLLSFGHLISQWAISKFGPPLPPMQALQGYVSILIATLANFGVEPTMTVNRDLLGIGILFFVIAIVMGSRAQQVQQHVQAHPSLTEGLGVLTRAIVEKSDTTVSTKSMHPSFDIMEAGECMVDVDEDPNPSPTAENNSVSRRIKRRSPAAEAEPKPETTEVDPSGRAHSWPNPSWFFGKNTQSPKIEPESEPETPEAKPEPEPSLTDTTEIGDDVSVSSALTDSAAIGDNTSVSSVSRRRKKRSTEDDAEVKPGLTDSDGVKEIKPKPTKSERGKISWIVGPKKHSLECEEEREPESWEGDLGLLSGMTVKRRVTCTEVIVAVSSGLAFGFFSVAFNVAMNDPFNWTDKEYKSLDDLLLVARTFVFFGFTFWLTSFLGNILRLHLELLGGQDDTREPLLQIIQHYLTKQSFSEGEQYASLAGICYGLATILHFQGGKITGYATAELVQASPIITFLWIAFVLEDFKNIKITNRLGFLYTGMFCSYLIAIVLFAMSGYLHAS